MIIRTKIVPLILFISAVPALSFAQSPKKADKSTLASLETHIQYLADDKLEGRRAGSPGEKMAGDYISIEFAKAGLQPKGDKNGWLQAFEIDEGRQISTDSYFSVNDRMIQPGKEYFPLSFSASGSVAGSPAIALQESGVPWFVDLKEMLETGQNNPHFDFDETIRARIKECSKKGATAVILYNTSRIAENLAFDPHDKSEPAAIPVLFITKEAKKKWLRDESASLDIKIRVGFTEKTRTARNVVGYLDNGAKTTAIIGAHYDHLGFGEDSNSLYRGTERQIHNGADDNASGVAGIIELAKLLKQSRLRNNNYLFIAFSGEELGLLGSKYFVEHPPIDLKTANYMINLDMVGRLNDSSHSLTIGGYGTSPGWGEACNTGAERKYFTVKYDSSGTGPSDHTSFYRKDIPVLFFFTGIHSDYHKPTDDYDKINYPGELQVLKYIYSIVWNLNNKGRLSFTKTREVQMGSSRFSVTLGIMPDYSFSGNGVRADGVSDGRPAQRAGIMAGDVILQLGDYPVPSLEKYMQALSKFKKGDTTIVKYRRGNDTLSASVQF
ncbi:MAG TPA: M20/M25/M40 family metallo-hydrolase [Puia sp.]|nr:M20/M25/M40 family metallo-hydrolase [Puia sp.]